MADDSYGARKPNPMAMTRILPKISRRKTFWDIRYINRQIRQCWLIRETGLAIAPVRDRAEAIAYYASFIHETLHPQTALLPLLMDIVKMGLHPDRCPMFLVGFMQAFLKDKHDFAIMNMGSMQHTAAAIGDFGSYDNKQKVSGKLTVSELAALEEGGGEL